MLALVVVAGAAVLSLACGSSQPAAPAGGPAAGGEAGQPVQPKVNRLVMGLVPPTVESNNPRHTGVTSMWHLNPMYEYMIDMDAKTGKLAPGLATNWQVAPDGLSIKLTLRKGVQFHGGYGEFTAKDVVHSAWDVTREDSEAGYPIQTSRRAVSETVATGDYEAVVKLKYQEADMIFLFSRSESGWEMMSKAHFDKLGKDPSMTETPVAGTSPYQFQARAQGAFIRFERVPFKHWRVMPDFPEFEFRWMKEASTRLAAQITGEIQLTSLPEDLLQQAAGQGMKLVKATVPSFRIFLVPHCCYAADVNDASKGFLFPNSPLANVQVRKALSKAINRDELNKAYFGGKGERLIVDPYHPTRPGWNPDWERRFPDDYGYDPAKARQMLADAGFGPSNPLTTAIHVGRVAGVAAAEDIQEAIAGYWRAVGVKVDLEVRDTNDMSRQRSLLVFDHHWGLVGTNADNFAALHYHSMNPTRGNKLEDFEIQKLVQDVSSTLDLAKQEEIWKKMGELIYQRAQTVPLFWLPAEAVYNPKIVAGWVWPGSISGTWTHVEYIRAAS